MDIILSASILAAFLAGAVALFAPCCITVLLPAYLASAFSEKRNLVRMTLLFFLGIAAVLVPIGLGAAGLAQLFEGFHAELYIAGGLLMLLFAALAVAGKGLSIFPKSRLTGGINVRNGKSVFLLGLFSGAATSCCAPVLAGAVTLAVLSGAFWKGLIVTFAYVFGMVLPLFITAFFYDRFKIEKSRFIRGRIFMLRIAGKPIAVHTTNLIAGGLFAVMGVVLIVLAASGSAFWAPGYQVSVGESLDAWSQSLFRMLEGVPDPLWAGVILLLFGFFVWKAVRRPPSKDASSEKTHSCH
jgi:cytochrome c biogenesis protein CcdA